MARDCHLLDKKLLSMTDVDLIFARIVPVGERKIRFDQFKQVCPARAHCVPPPPSPPRHDPTALLRHDGHS
jgi:hypothetical protein